jgi:hypothetical protein
MCAFGGSTAFSDGYHEAAGATLLSRMVESYKLSSLSYSWTYVHGLIVRQQLGARSVPNPSSEFPFIPRYLA